MVFHCVKNINTDEFCLSFVHGFHSAQRGCLKEPVPRISPKWVQWTLHDVIIFSLAVLYNSHFTLSKSIKLLICCFYPAFFGTFSTINPSPDVIFLNSISLNPILNLIFLNAVCGGLDLCLSLRWHGNVPSSLSHVSPRLPANAEAGKPICRRTWLFLSCLEPPHGLDFPESITNVSFQGGCLGLLK